MTHADTLSQNIKALLEARNISIRQLAEQTSVAASSLTDSLKSKKGLPIDVTVRVADALGFTVEDLSKKTVIELLQAEFRSSADYPGLAPDEAEMLSTYKTLSQEGKEYMRQTMAMAKKTYEIEKPAKLLEVSNQTVNISVAAIGESVETLVLSKEQADEAYEALQEDIKRRDERKKK